MRPLSLSSRATAPQESTGGWSEPPNFPSRRVGAQSLPRFLWLRLVLLAVLLLAGLLAPRLLGVEFAHRPLVIILIVMMALTAIGFWRARSAAVAEPEVFLHLLADTAALVLTMHYTGGYMNPLISLLLLPLASAAATLSARYTWALALVTVTAYTVLMEQFEPLRLAPGANMFRLHLAGMWIAFVLSVLVIAFFVQRMSASVRSRDRALAQAREQMLRQQQVAAVGALAAGAAHELGTPLATMAVVARELEIDLAGDPRAEDLQALRQQIEACKGIVARLQRRAGAQATESRVALDAYLNELVEHWRLIRPGITCRVDLRGTRPGPLVLADAALGQAIINLLNNAADASSEEITLEADWSRGEIAITVRDHGPGVSAQLLTRLGSEPITTKAAGHAGLGLVLARTTADQFGGRLSLRNTEQGGLIAQLSLPLAVLQA